MECQVLESDVEQLKTKQPETETLKTRTQPGDPNVLKKIDEKKTLTQIELRCLRE